MTKIPHDYIKIDKDLERLIPPLSKDEFDQLEKNILADGINDPIDLWGVKVVDGHNRYRIARKHGIAFEVRHRTFPGEDAAKQWMLTKQLGRRNLTPEKQSYLRGHLYDETKAALARNPGPLPQQGELGDTVSPNSMTAAAVVAADQNVDERTVKRDAQFAANCDALCEEVRSAVLNREVKGSRKAIKALAELTPAKQKSTIAAAIKDGVKLDDILWPEPEADEPEEDTDWLAPLKEPYDNAVKAIQLSRRTLKKCSDDESDGAHLVYMGAWNRIKQSLDEAEDYIKANMPWAGCPKCSTYEARGKGCKSCQKTGFITKSVHQGLEAKA